MQVFDLFIMLKSEVTLIKKFIAAPAAGVDALPNCKNQTTYVLNKANYLA